MKVIDIHSHICWPGPWANLRDELLKCFYDIEGLLERQEEGGVDISVVSSPSFVVEEQDETEWLDYIKRYNNFAAELASRHPGRFIGMATAIAYKGGEFLKETERAVSDYGLRGVRIASSVKGEYLDSPRAADFFSQVCQLIRTHS